MAAQTKRTIQMNYWTQLSIEYAAQKSYLDDLFRVYLAIPEGIREIDNKKWDSVTHSFKSKSNVSLIKDLLSFEHFPLKDSYVAYLKRDASAIDRNPQTINRLCGRLYEMGLDEIYSKCSEPKETNRQIGPMFKEWIKRGSLGIKPVDMNTFISSDENAILAATDSQMQQFAKEKLSYTRNKGLDFLARFNGKYVIGEAKFLTDFGGHQNAQLEDALLTLNTQCSATVVAILDGVCYIEGRNKMYNTIVSQDNKYILSALVLREFLYHI